MQSVVYILLFQVTLGGIFYNAGIYSYFVHSVPFVDLPPFGQKLRNTLKKYI